MVGLSYPGISQLFVAQSQPPSLAAITPLSVYGDTGTGVLRPGGILNTGFATSWADQVLANAAARRARRGCARSSTTATPPARPTSALRLQNVDATQKALDNPYYTDEVAGPLDIRRFAGDIEVPVFLASAWQDEQTGPSFADLLDRFDAAPVTRFTLYNGLHADGFAPQILVGVERLPRPLRRRPGAVDPTAHPVPHPGVDPGDLRRRRSRCPRTGGPGVATADAGSGPLRGRALRAGHLRERRRRRRRAAGRRLRAHRHALARPRTSRPSGGGSRPTARWPRRRPQDRPPRWGSPTTPTSAPPPSGPGAARTSGRRNPAYDWRPAPRASRPRSRPPP